MGKRDSSLSLSEQAYVTIRAMILELRLLPGQSILVHELASQLGMSRTPVREAVARLSTEGLVTTVPRKGMVVTIPTVDAMREIYEIIAGVEGQAMKLAAERADDVMIKRLEQAVDAQEDALARDDLAAWVYADRQFHDLIIQAAGNKRMVELMRLYDGHLHRVRLATIHLRPKPTRSTSDHRSAIEVIRQRDGDRARDLHIAHRERALAEMLRVVGDYSALVLRASAPMGELAVAST